MARTNGKTPGSGAAAAVPARLWYSEGLRFACARCGACCHDHGESTVVVLNEGEPERLAHLLGIAHRTFLARFTVARDGFVCLANRGKACVFFDPGRGCTVRRARPLQCRAWPFWPENLERAKWISEVEAFCPGAGRGRRHPAEKIERIARRMKFARALVSGWEGTRIAAGAWKPGCGAGSKRGGVGPAGGAAAGGGETQDCGPRSAVPGPTRPDG
ncbi:MAG: YkgJ family cysteine cluster protein [Planctomycetes bacterium]|nr:YkgJ family cysteine cluster protein [Planctomycetota bacterium]